MQCGWYLILMIWGEQYSDEDCNKLIRQAMHFSENCQGAVVFSDRLDRNIDPRGRLISIPADFSDEAMKVGGLPVKLSMFDVEGLPNDAVCVYVDLDSVIVGNIDYIATLSEKARLWTIPTFPRPFSRWSRFIWKVSNRKFYRFGNSSVFVYKNRYQGNPTDQFRRKTQNGALPAELRHDDRFIGWSSQDVVRGISTHFVVNFRYEFLFPVLWMGWVMSKLRYRSRSSIVLITFAGPLTKPKYLVKLDDGDKISDHHGRVGVWSDKFTSQIKEKIISAFFV